MKARALDQLCAGTPPGPAEVKLSHYGDVRPLVVGSFAEVSEFVDELACAAATSGVATAHASQAPKKYNFGFGSRFGFGSCFRP